METIRSFIAIPIPGDIHKKLGEIIHSLQPELPGIIRWVSPENIHLTLKFLGNVPTAHLAALQETLKSIAGAQAPFEVHVEKLGAFPSARRAKVVWVGVAVSQQLRLLYQAIEKEAYKLGFEKEGRPYAPHLTLGRVKHDLTPGENNRIEGLLSKNQDVRPGSFIAKELILFRSDLTPGGSVYTPLSTAVFSGQDGVQ